MNTGSCNGQFKMEGSCKKGGKDLITVRKEPATYFLN